MGMLISLSKNIQYNIYMKNTNHTVHYEKLYPLDYTYFIDPKKRFYTFNHTCEFNIKPIVSNREKKNFPKIEMEYTIIHRTLIKEKTIFLNPVFHIDRTKYTFTIRQLNSKTK